MICSIACAIGLCFFVLFMVILVGGYKDFMWPLTALFFAIIATFVFILPLHFLIERVLRKYSRFKKAIVFAACCFSLSLHITLIFTLINYSDIDWSINEVIYGFCFYNLPLVGGYLGLQIALGNR